MARHLQELMWTPRGFIEGGDLPRIRHTPPKHRLPRKGDLIRIKNHPAEFVINSSTTVHGTRLYVVSPARDIWCAARTIADSEILEVIL